jgi:hypothetical protein
MNRFQYEYEYEYEYDYDVTKQKGGNKKSVYSTKHVRISVMKKEKSDSKKQVVKKHCH